ncbi:MAG: hypothetical protein JWO59_1957 [Chloroflexi bacterium]|nr:hypothetical protein [Chloroflexota bacterium]
MLEDNLYGAPIYDDIAHTEAIARGNVFELSGRPVKTAKYWRVSPAATDTVIVHTMSVFRATIADAA